MGIEILATKRENWALARKGFNAIHKTDIPTFAEVCIGRTELPVNSKVHETYIDTSTGFLKMFYDGHWHYKIGQAVDWERYLQRTNQGRTDIILTDGEYEQSPGIEFVVVEADDSNRNKVRYSILKKDFDPAKAYTQTDLKSIDSATGFSLGDKIDASLPYAEILRHKSWLALFGYDFSKDATTPENFSARGQLKKFADYVVEKTRFEYRQATNILGPYVMDFNFGPIYGEHSQPKLLPISAWGNVHQFSATPRIINFPANFVKILKID